MSRLLWTSFFENDFCTFRHVLDATTQHTSTGRKASSQKPVPNAIGLNTPGLCASPVNSLSTSPSSLSKDRKSSRVGVTGDFGPASTLTKADVNRKDADGLTLLHHVVSTPDRHALPYVRALVSCNLVDLYVQDDENGWTALHRAFYFGNIVAALAILERDADTSADRVLVSTNQTPLGLIKVRDRDGLGPLDLYAETIRPSAVSRRHWATHHLPQPSAGEDDDADGQGSFDSDPDMDGDHTPASRSATISGLNLHGDECFTFGSNRNATLGFGDEDDRHRPERIYIKRPEHLIQRFYTEFLRDCNPHDSNSGENPSSVPLDSIPWPIRSRPIVVQDVQMSKLHTAVLTTDPEANLYMCGHGQSGRLGLGHEQTKFNLTCVEGGSLTGRKVAIVALGQNHSLAVSDTGEVSSWGSNADGQLGYNLPKTALKDEEPVQSVPRQIFGVIKRACIVGVAASRIHSVAFTSASLFTWGRNEGQLGIVDSDARSLELQLTPRKVAPSLLTSPITSVCANERATVCRLASSDCWVFANYGYTLLQCPANTLPNYYLSSAPVSTEQIRHFAKIATGGDTICAVTAGGSIYGWSVSRPQGKQTGSASTTGPAKIRGALSVGQSIWSPRTQSMDAEDVGVDIDGSLIITTAGGSVWKRSRRAKLQTPQSATNHRAKDYKISRVSGLTNVKAVRASAHGSYAAIRRDHDTMKAQVPIEPPSLWRHLSSLLSLYRLPLTGAKWEKPRFWQPSSSKLALLKQHLLESTNIDNQLQALQEESTLSSYDAIVRSSLLGLAIPAHLFILTARSAVVRDEWYALRSGHKSLMSTAVSIHVDDHARLNLTLEGVDTLTLVNFVLYCYTDEIVDYWNGTHRSADLAHRNRQIRSELIKIAIALKMSGLEVPVRQMCTPSRTMHDDLAVAHINPAFNETADMVVHLADDEIHVHRALMCVRCPFFDAMFNGADGYWIRRRELAGSIVKVDLSHVDSAVFRLVLRHIYTDAGVELFEDIFASSEDDFLDILLTVMNVADELMLDRLSQICQHVLGKHANLRNICSLMTDASLMYSTGLKDASLLYMCLNLEALIHSRSLDELDQALLLDLQDTIRDKQRSCLPRARNRRGQTALLLPNDELTTLVKQNRKAKIAALDNNSRRIVSATPRAGGPLSPHVFKSKATHGNINIGDSPDIVGGSLGKAPASSPDRLDLGGPAQPPGGHGRQAQLHVQISDAGHFATPVRCKYGPSTAPADGQPGGPSTQGGSSVSDDKSTHRPWEAANSASSGVKFALKDIMAQTSASRMSSISLGLAARNPEKLPESGPEVMANKSAKLSQKDRKRLQQEQAAQLTVPESASSPRTGSTKEVPSSRSGSVWQTTPTQKVPSLKDLMTSQAGPPAIVSPSGPSSVNIIGARPLTMRQTIANPRPDNPSKTSARTAVSPSPSPSTSSNVTGPAVSRAVSVPKPRQTATASYATSPSPISNHRPAAAAPRTMQHSPRAAEPTLQLSMADILSQQQLEKDIIRDAAAKRSLQEIQEEQAFQEWWDKEQAKYSGADASPQEGNDEDQRGGSGSGSGSTTTNKGRSRGPRKVTGHATGQQGDVAQVQISGETKAKRGGGGRSRAHAGGAKQESAHHAPPPPPPPASAAGPAFLQSRSAQPGSSRRRF